MVLCRILIGFFCLCHEMKRVEKHWVKQLCLMLQCMLNKYYNFLDIFLPLFTCTPCTSSSLPLAPTSSLFYVRGTNLGEESYFQKMPLLLRMDKVIYSTFAPKKEAERKFTKFPFPSEIDSQFAFGLTNPFFHSAIYICFCFEKSSRFVHAFPLSLLSRTQCWILIKYQQLEKFTFSLEDPIDG